MKPLIPKIFITTFASLIVFLVKASVYLPIPQRGAEGHGLYQLVNGLQFYETAFFTFLTLFIICYFCFKLYAHWAAFLGLAYSSINFGLMIVDTRIHEYTPWIEKTVESLYGPKNLLILLAPVSVIFGIILIGFVIKKGGLITSRLN